MIAPELKTEIAQALPLLHGWCTLEKAAHLAKLAIESERLGAVVEIGIFGGQSLIPMALALRHSGSKQFALGIDPMSVDAAIEGGAGAKENEDWWANKVNLEEVYSGFVRSVLDLKLAYYCRWIRMRNDTCASLFRKGTVGLLHLDSNHSEHTSCLDAEAWSPLIAEAGYLVFDDSHWPSQAKAYRILKKRFAVIGDYPNGQGNQYTVFQNA